MTKLTLLAALFLGACSVGEVDGTGLVGTVDAPIGSDAGGSGTLDGPAALLKNTCGMAGIAAPAHIHTDGGTTHKGESCMSNVACHAAGGAGGAWSFAGTAYTDPGAGSPMVGTQIRIISADGATLIAKTVTDTDGNFYSSQAIGAGPYITDITQCGKTPMDIRAMVSPITTNHDCNGGTACHAQPGGTAIYLAP